MAVPQDQADLTLSPEMAGSAAKNDSRKNPGSITTPGAIASIVIIINDRLSTLR